MATVTFTTGQGVPWKASPTGVAQVEFLHRRLVTIGYRRFGRWRRRRVRPERLLVEPMLFPVQNPWYRGLVVRSKTFELRAAESN